MDLGIKDQVAIVTGGGSGIGAETCRLLAEEGVHVAVVDINLDQAEETAEMVRSKGVKAIAIKVDVTNFEETQMMVERTIAELGRVDILDCVAGLARPDFFVNTKPEDWQTEIDVCLYGVMNCCKSVMVPMMEQNSGTIVNVASDAGKAGEKMQVAYSAAKAGIMGFTRALAKELGRNSIRVNAVCPGFTSGTGMTSWVNEEGEQALTKAYPLRRLGAPVDIANMIVVLSSETTTGWVTGQAVSVNGGYFMGG